MGRSIHERAPCGSRDMFASPEGGRSDVNTGAIQTGGGNRSAAVKMRGNIRSGVRRYTEFGNADQANDPRLSGVVQKKNLACLRGLSVSHPRTVNLMVMTTRNCYLAMGKDA